MIFSLESKIAQLKEPWQSLEIARFDDYAVRLGLFHGSYHWHVHDNGDELFFVYRGSITIHLRDTDDVIVREGEFALVPKGTEHCPESIEPSYVVMFERHDLSSTNI